MIKLRFDYIAYPAAIKFAQVNTARRNAAHFFRFDNEISF